MPPSVRTEGLHQRMLGPMRTTTNPSRHGTRGSSRLVRLGPALPLILAASLGALSACAPSTSDRSLVVVDRAQLADRLSAARGEVLLIDVRPPEIYRQGTIPGAVNRGLTDIRMTTDPEEFEGYSRVIVFGQNPGSTRAPAVAKRLIRIGVDDVYYFEGGYDAWSEHEERGVAD